MLYALFLLINVQQANSERAIKVFYKTAICNLMSHSVKDNRTVLAYIKYCYYHMMSVKQFMAWTKYGNVIKTLVHHIFVLLTQYYNYTAVENWREKTICYMLF